MSNKLVSRLRLPVAELPVFLCPSILRVITRPLTRVPHPQPKPLRQALQRREFTASIRNRTIEPTPGKSKHSLDQLPQQCAGCGALSQTVDQNGAGFYTLSRASVRHYLDTLPDEAQNKLSAEDELVKEALEKAGSAATGIRLEDFVARPSKILEPPMCDRCHKLKHHETGTSIIHPSVRSLQDTIFESPHKYNHVYHVIDAADFPMSLVPGLHKLLHLTPQRSLNRRSKTGRFYHGKKTEVSFIITRSDLLAPVKTQVDSMMPYLRETLRDALGNTAKDVRLGNIRCVSAKMGWWTRELKEEIWKRGGGGWLVGKVNVGKSQLFHDVFPKGRRERGKPLVGNMPKMLNASDESYRNPETWSEAIASLGDPNIAADQKKTDPVDFFEESQEGEFASKAAFDASSEEDSLEDNDKFTESSETESLSEIPQSESERTEIEEETTSSATDSLDVSSLLPPVPPEVDYPVMPLVSSLPGTTASPIRLSFGSGKGELIDLPGLSRGDLELYVQPEHRSELVMHSRIKPEQQVIKPGQSLLLGGFIRITPTTPEVMILAYAFTPIHPHLTATEKAVGIQAQTGESNVQNISLPGTGEKIKSAGTFHLKWDVTKQRAGPLTSPKAVGIKPERLPFKVLATDILIEGCGWVELVAQVRKSRPNNATQIRKEEAEWEAQNTKNLEAEWEPENDVIDPEWPAIEVFSPEGRFIAARRPMNAWLFIANKPTNGKTRGRPRKSMKGAKKAEKLRMRVKSS